MTLHNTRSFTTKEAADRLGLKRYQLLYLIDSGHVPDARLRISNRRVFTDKEVARIEKWLADNRPPRKRNTKTAP